jgi:hypothetical protein
MLRLGPTSRKGFVMRIEVRAAAALALLLVASGCGSGSSSPGGAAKLGGPLNIVAWEGYTDPSFVNPFQKQTGCHIKSRTRDPAMKCLRSSDPVVGRATTWCRHRGTLLFDS